jgi:UDP-glucose:(heptosyl)LPS alpha-1,3-glucosyltransferase
MNIALIVHDLHENRGHSLYAKVLADQLSERHKVSVFANSFEDSAQRLWSSQYVPAWRGSALACIQTFPLGLRRYRRELAEFDICHTQGYCGGNPNVVTAHICVAAYLNSLRDARLRNRASLRWIAATEASFYQRFQGKIIAVSEKVAKELQESYDIRAAITVIPHGVSAERFGNGSQSFRDEIRRELGIAETETMALYAGDLTKVHSYLKELAVAAPAIKLMIITPSRGYSWDAPNVFILPPTSQLERYYAAADAFVFPTTYDAFGMVVLEAMAAGLPVFTSDQAGAAEVIQSGKDGFVYPLAEWVGSTAMRLADRNSLERVGSTARQTAGRHDWPSVVTAVEKVYEQILAE